MDIKIFHSAFENMIGSLSNKSDSEPIKQFIVQLKNFLQQLDDIDQGTVNEIVSEFETQSQEPIFQEVGKILRKFHDKLTVIREGIPNNLAKLTQSEFTDVTSKLQHVLTMTDRAANKTMDLAEVLMDELNKQNELNIKVLAQINASDNIDKMDTKSILDSVSNHLKMYQSKNDDMQQKLTEILIAQDYQDLTGQVINKILNLIKSLENDLTSLIKKFGKIQLESKSSENQLQGPLTDDHEGRNSQNDVNDLLSQFGF